MTKLATAQPLRPFWLKPLSAKACKSVAAGMNPMDLKRGIDLAVELLLKRSEALHRRSKTTDELLKLARSRPTVSAKLASMIADAMQKVGNEGVITVEEEQALETELMSLKACSSTVVTCHRTSSQTLTR